VPSRCASRARRRDHVSNVWCRYPNVCVRAPGDRKVESRTGRRIALRGVTKNLAPGKGASQYLVYNELKLVRCMGVLWAPEHVPKG